MREAEAVAGLARRDHRARRAAGALGVGAVRIEPEPQRDADRARPCLEQRDGAVDAAAHRDGDALRVAARAHRGADRVCERVDGQRLAADRGGLEQRQPAQVGCDAGRVGVDDRLAVHASRTAAQSAPRDESPYSSMRRRVLRLTAETGLKVRGAEAPLTMLRPRRLCHVRVNLDKPGGCRARPSDASAPRPDAGSLSHGVGSTWIRGARTTSSTRADAAYAGSPGSGVGPVICCTPRKPEAAGERIGQVELPSRHVRRRGRAPGSARSSPCR